jgi:hypothetical protein
MQSEEDSIERGEVLYHEPEGWAQEACSGGPA